MKLLFSVLVILLPWPIRRRLLNRILGYEIHPTATIGYSIVMPNRLRMEAGSRIGHLTVARGLEEITLGAYARLGNLNWITGFPLEMKGYFEDQPERYPALHIEDHAAIVHRNIVDCTDRITIGRFTVVAGWWHQFLTHSIDLRTGRQSSAPIRIGEYCFVATGAILLKGSSLPNYSALGAGSVLHKKFDETYCLYSGTPAQPVRKLDRATMFFTRTWGISK